MSDEPLVPEQDLEPKDRPEQLHAVEGTGGLLRLSEVVEEAQENLDHEKGQFQREYGTAFRNVYEQLPEGAHRPANADNAAERVLRPLEDHGRARGFLKINPKPPHNFYESMKSSKEDRPSERLIPQVLASETSPTPKPPLESRPHHKRRGR